MLADGKPMADMPGAVKWSGGANGVEMNAVFLAPVPVTADKLNLVIEAGWIEKEKVCNGAAASVVACQ
jgi:D-xylose transport system substrate-binding protein